MFVSGLSQNSLLGAPGETGCASGCWRLNEQSGSICCSVAAVLQLMPSSLHSLPSSLLGWPEPQDVAAELKDTQAEMWRAVEAEGEQ